MHPGRGHGHPPGQGGVDGHVALHHPVEVIGQLGAGGGLQQEPRRPDPQGLEEVLLVVVDGEEHHLQARMELDQLGAQIQPAGAPEAHVEQDDVGLKLPRQPEGVVGVGGGGGDHDPAAVGGQHRLQPLEHDLLVVDQEQPEWGRRRLRSGRGDNRQVLPHAIHLRGEARRTANS